MLDKEWVRLPIVGISIEKKNANSSQIVEEEKLIVGSKSAEKITIIEGYNLVNNEKGYAYTYAYLDDGKGEYDYYVITGGHSDFGNENQENMQHDLHWGNKSEKVTIEKVWDGYVGHASELDKKYTQVYFYIEKVEKNHGNVIFFKKNNLTVKKAELVKEENEISENYLEYKWASTLGYIHREENINWSIIVGEVKEVSSKERQKRDIATALAVVGLVTGIAGTIASSIGAWAAIQTLPTNICYIRLTIINNCSEWDFYLDESEGIDITQAAILKNTAVTYVHKLERDWESLKAYLKFKCTHDLYKKGNINWSNNAFYVSVNNSNDGGNILEVKKCNKNNRLYELKPNAQLTIGERVLEIKSGKETHLNKEYPKQVSASFYNSHIYASTMTFLKNNNDFSKLKVVDINLQIGGNPFN